MDLRNCGDFCMKWEVRSFHGTLWAHEDTSLDCASYQRECHDFLEGAPTELNFS